MRVVALLAAHNEERFVGGCIAHLARNGVETYLIDNESTDATVEVARSFLGEGLAGIETMPRNGVYAWRPLLERKEELASTLRADWFVHLDADEIRQSPEPAITLADAIAEVDALGYDAVGFQEYTFVPTREAPDHDHPRFRETMQHYYAFSPGRPDRLNAWKRQPRRVDLATSGGHRVSFPELKLYPTPFPMRHYLYLSLEHAVEKYVERVYDDAELQVGWHTLRAALEPSAISLISQSELKESRREDDLDPSDPWSRHPLFQRS